MSLGFWEILLIVIACYFLFGNRSSKAKKPSERAPEVKNEKEKASIRFPFGLN